MLLSLNVNTGLYTCKLINFDSVSQKRLKLLLPKVTESVARILLIQHDWNTEKILERLEDGNSLLNSYFNLTS